MAAVDFRDRLLSGLGGDWPKPGPLNTRTTRTEQKDGYRLVTLSYEVEAVDEPVRVAIPVSTL